jgi:phosphoribosyl 1,2-cyclic phosphodiesterase
VTRDFEDQSRHLPEIGAVVITHGHADASGGISSLNGWLKGRGIVVPIYATGETLRLISARSRDLSNCDLNEFEPGERRRVGPWTLSCRLVPHARDSARFPTVAWRLTSRGSSVVYASDVARPTADLRKFARDADVLVIDGATNKRRIFSHLRIDEDLPEVCRWSVDQIFITQIGKSVPAHDDLVQLMPQLCPRAEPAYDGLEVEL